MSRSGVALAVVGAVTAALLAGCGVPVDDAPRTILAAEIPVALPQAATAPPEDFDGKVALYFVKDGKVAVNRRSVATSQPIRPLLDLLFAGPTDTEQAGGAGTALNGVTLQDVEVRRGVAVITLAGQVDRLRPEAFAQIVFTLVSSQAQGVRFRYQDRDLPVPNDKLQPTTSALTRADYAALQTSPAPAPSPPATPSAVPVFGPPTS